MPRVDTLDRPIAVGFTEDEIVVTLASGSVLRNPLSWHPWLRSASAEQRLQYELSTFSIDWPALDEGLDLDGIRYGIPSETDLRKAYEETAHRAESLTAEDRLVFSQVQDRLRSEGSATPLAEALRLLLTEVEKHPNP